MIPNLEAAKGCVYCNETGVIKHYFGARFGEQTESLCEICQQKQPKKVLPHNYTSIRGKWDDIWMGLAVDIASRSTCKIPNRNVGCVIVSDDNTKVLSLGYNGSAKGDDNSCEYNGAIDIKVGSSRCTCIHAEMNALTKLDTSNPCKKNMYITLSPCDLCWKLIVNAGIDEVIYMTEHKPENIVKLRGLGVKVRKYV